MRSSAYRDLFRLPAVRRQALAGLIAQVTQGAAGIGLILVVHAQTGSLALAGSVVGALSIAVGVARPVQGRLIDRRGARTLMALCSVVHSAALAGIVALAQIGAPGSSLVALGVLAGLALPPISTSMRVEWGALVPVGERTAAYSLVYLTQELSILIGPLVLAALIAAASASLALLAVAALSGAGTLAFAAVLEVEPGERSPRKARRTRDLLRAPEMRVLIGVAALIGGTVGALEVALPTIATNHGSPAASGLLIAALSVGGIAGATTYGSRRWLTTPAVRLLLLLAALATVLAVMIPVASLVVLGALLLLAGVALNPSLTTISLLVDQHASRASAAEAFGWLSSGIAAGMGVASAIAGALTDVSHPHAAFLLAAIAGAAAAALVGATRRGLAVHQPLAGADPQRKSSA